VPILVYQMGKGGSSSIRNTLLLRGLHPVLHLHTLSPLREKRLEDIEIEEALKPAVAREIEHARTVFENLDTWSRLRLTLHERMNERRLAHHLLRPRRPLKIITSVREPIAANVSMFFQLLPWYTGSRYASGRLSTDELIRIFRERYSCHRPLIWFDEEMRHQTGVDVYRHGFPMDRGSMAFREGQIDVLVLKTETDDSVKEQAISEYLGIEGIRLVESNVGAQKAYAQQYREFKERIRFPDAFFQTMYQSKYARHFYSDTEIGQFTRQWHGPSEPPIRAL
jgi:hypothetical protein